MRVSRRTFLAVTSGTAVAGMAGVAAPTATATPARGALGEPIPRIDGYVKVTGRAPYAFEFPGVRPTYLFAVSSTIVRGTITEIDTAAAEALPGVVAVLTHRNAPRLAETKDRELAVLQSEKIGYRGQYVAAVVAESPEIAREAAGLVQVRYAELPHQVVPGDSETETHHENIGDVDAAWEKAAVTVDRTYTTPMQHNNPMEPHTTMATWNDGGLVLHESTQGVHDVRETLAPMFGLAPEKVRVICPNVGGGFGAKGLPHAPVVLTALAAKLTGGRSVKYALTRQQMFAVVGYRPPTRQRLRLGADANGTLTVFDHEAHEYSSRTKKFVEGSATAAGMMYAAPNRRTRGFISTLDLPVPTWMRAPGKCPGMYAAESAIDEMAVACGIDPVEFRIRNEPRVDPESGKPFSSRNVVACLREGARRFGWRAPARREGAWLIGTGVAASTYPTESVPGSTAHIRFTDGHYVVSIGAADLGTGAWTALSQIAADQLRVSVGEIVPRIGDTAFPKASGAGGSTGITAWGSAIVEAARVFRDKHGAHPPEGAEAEATVKPDPEVDKYSRHAFGAQFAEVRVHADTGEVRVSRMVGVFAAGRIINGRTARSQFLGGMTMGISMALHERSVLDPATGHVVNHDFAGYHVAAHADIQAIEAHWLPEDDPHVNPLGTKGIGEVGIVGTAAAVANAAFDATGIRVRDLPLTPDHFVV